MPTFGDLPCFKALRRRLAPPRIAGAPSCWRKHKHLTKGVAEAHIRALQKLDHPTQGLLAYRCRHCGRWHIGRPRWKETA